VYLDDLITPEIGSALSREAAERAQQTIDGFDSETAARPFAEYGLDEKQLREIFLGTIVEDFALAMRIAEALTTAAERYTIELVVLNEDVGLVSKTCALWAMNADIPTLNVSHSAAIGSLAPTHCERNTSDVVFFGEKDAEAYTAADIPMAGAHFIGNPDWDVYASLLANRDEVRIRCSQEYGIAPGRQIIVFATTWASNFYAFAEPSVYEDSLRAVFAAYSALQTNTYHLVVKDRAANAPLFARVGELAAEVGLAANCWTFTTKDLPSFIVCAAAVISVNSNVTVEAALCGVPAINIWSPASWLIGPYFDALDGVVEVEQQLIGPALERVLGDNSFRTQIVNAASAALSKVNATSDGSCAVRIAQLMFGLRKQSTAAYRSPALDRNRLETCLANVDGPFRLALEVTASSDLERPASNIRRVSAANNSGALTAADLHSAGVQRGDIDLAIFAHSLEEIWDPWATLATVRTFLAADGRIIVTVNNLRSLRMIESLVRGDFGSAPMTADARRTLRRFTVREIVSLLQETGFRIIKAIAVRDPAYSFLPLQSGPGTTTIELSNASLKAVPLSELSEWTAAEFILTAQPA
jgi:hypothetical protein